MGGWDSSLYFENIEDNKAKINSSFFFFKRSKLVSILINSEAGRGYPEGRFSVCSHVCNIALD